MREIKFRAWHEHGKRMVYGPSDDIVNPSWVLAMCSANNIEPMQYTGLKDHNGKDIYEGDIVTARKESNTAEFTGYVHYVNSQYFVNYIGYESYYQTLIYLHGFEYKPIEVIGNIYENPELLKG